MRARPHPSLHRTAAQGLSGNRVAGCAAGELERSVTEDTSVMAKQDLPTALLEAVEAELKPRGFTREINKKAGRRALTSVSVAFVRADKQRTERFHLRVSSERSGYSVSPSVGVRFEEVEKIFHRTSGYDRPNQKESTTVGLDLWRVFGREHYQVIVSSEADLKAAAARVVAIFEEKAEPYFAQFRTLAAVDAAVNDKPGEDCVHREMEWLRGSTGLIVAGLVGRANYDQLVPLYLETVRKKSPHLLPRFESLLTDLKKPGSAVKRHAALGRELHCPPARYLNELDQRLDDIAGKRAGGQEQFEREGNAARARALEEYEQNASQNPLLSALFGQLGFVDALRAPVTGGYEELHGRNEELGVLLEFAVLQHLGYGPIKDLVERLNDGVTRALDYFLGDWWKGNEEDAKALDKSRPDRGLIWWDGLSKGLLLCGLTGRWDDAVKICSWFDERVLAEYPLGQVADDYTALFLCIASDLRAQPIPGVQKILARVKAGRDKRPRLLCAAWEAAVARDQKAFDKAFKATVDFYLKNEADGGPIGSWVALDQSLVWLIAERNGLKLPKLDDELDAAVVRRQSIGLTGGA
jgi:hypothetical protein